MKQDEAVIQKSILTYLEHLSRYYRIYFFRSAAGAILTDTGRYFKTGRAGTPDITCCWQGKYIGLEVKTSKGRQTPTQRQAQVEIETAGGHYYIVRGIEDVERIFKQEEKKW